MPHFRHWHLSPSHGIIDFKNVKVDNLADGTYTLWIRPVDEAQEYYIGAAVEAQFVISTTPTDITYIQEQQLLELYDVMGHLVDRKPSTDMRGWNVPTAGVYILKTADKTIKVQIP